MFDQILERKILNLSHAILSNKDEALCSELFASLTENLIQADLSIDDKKDTILISKAKDMIHASLEQILKLDEISNELHLSKYQFIRLFKAGTGISPYQYYLNCKIERAKQLIEKHKDIYSAVAECGFVDLTHLNKHFKSVYGTTVYEYLTHIS